MRKLILLTFVYGSIAFQFPFQFPFLRPKLALNQAVTEDAFVFTTPKVAIIGAGAGGSSSAFWIAKAKERFGVNIEVDVYEREHYVGGRSTVVYPYENTSLPELELGASIFVKANKNLWRASDEFNLTRRSFGAEDYETGIWDGEKILLSFGGSWWDTVKVLWRYGIFSPKKTQTVVGNMIDKFLTLYALDAPRWDNISDLAFALDWSPFILNTTQRYLLKQGVSEKYINEVVEAATRVNYGQNVDEMHALEGACSMAATGAAAIKGGNYQIFEQFLKRSGANVLLNTTVESVFPKSASSHLWTVRSGRGSVDYKAVILAAPYSSTGIAFPLSISSQIPKQPYVHLHVTLLTTTSPTPSPEYFAMSQSSVVPRMMLTTYQGVRNGGKEPQFNSLSYHGLVREGEWAVKIFSKERITDEWLNNIFKGKVGWVFRKEWDAYPKLPPTSSFPPVKLDQGLYYVNAFEPMISYRFISTMETETIASRNVVDLLLNEHFHSSICGTRISERKENLTFKDTGDFVAGWDC
ncbi:Prenylcysteine lyase-domain-containing protein [Crucibulum laeve]|uniref:Prenylcysteine lyase-domain-containing protein n=1 Tax=Crucibulum laeve TaxID=68775 RepID=A0A5C3LXD8_9AGAR|nr:Prenylcysteine lyase-domain-containing protein [Crucibulum laeve]